MAASLGRAADPDLERMLEQLAASGEGWARQALDPDSPFLFVSAAGFKESFHEVAQSEERALILWTLDELYPG